MTQDFLVFIIIALTLLYVAFSLKKTLLSKAKSKCEGCTGCDAKVMFDGAALKKKNGGSCH